MENIILSIYRLYYVVQVQTTDERLKLISAVERIRPLLRSTFQLITHAFGATQIN